MDEIDALQTDPYYLKFVSRPLSTDTRKRFGIAMSLYLRFYQKEKGIEITPSGLLQKIEEDRKKPIRDRGQVENEWLDFVVWLQDKYKKRDGHQKQLNKPLALTTIKSYVGVIKTFYSFFGYPLSKKATLPRKISQSTGRIENISLPYRADMIKKIIAVMTNNEHKVLTLLMFQSGLDISTALEIRWRDIKDGLEGGECPLMLRLRRVKTGVNFRTFIGKDAIEALHVHIREIRIARYKCKTCGKSWKRVRYKCPSCGTKTVHPITTDLEPDTFIFGLNRKNRKKVSTDFQQGLRDYAILAGLVTKEQMKRADMNPARPHALRAGFSTILKLQGVHGQIIDYMMGHKDVYGGAYTHIPDEELRAIYKKVERHLSISEITDVAKLEEKLNHKIEEQGIIIKGLKAQIKEMEQEQKDRARSIAGDYDPELVKKIMELVDAELKERQ